MPTIDNNLDAGYIQPIFNDELPNWMSIGEANNVSFVLLAHGQGGWTSGEYKREIIKNLSNYGHNPMWVIRQESNQKIHQIYELDINGRGTGVYLQTITTLGRYNVFLLPES